MKTNNEILLKIKELTPLAPPNWVETVAQQMGKSVDSVYAYIRGSRGIKKGYHKEVLKLMIPLVETEKKEIEALINH